jgi:hypothetical protein
MCIVHVQHSLDICYGVAGTLSGKIAETFLQDMTCWNPGPQSAHHQNAFDDLFQIPAVKESVADYTHSENVATLVATMNVAKSQPWMRRFKEGACQPLFKHSRTDP